MAEAVDLPPNLASSLMQHASNGAQLAADDARDLRREMHLTHQTSKVITGAMGYRLASEAGSGRTRAEANEGSATAATSPKV